MVLVDRLRSAAVLQLRRPIRGEDEQRNPPEGGLDDRRREVDRGGSGSPEENDHSPRRPSNPQREEPGRTLVDQNPDPYSVVGPQGERQWRRARPGADDRIANPGPNQLLHEDA